MVTSGEATGVPSRSSEVARLAPPDRAAGDDAGRARRNSAAARLGIEDHRHLAGRDLARAELGDRAARRLEADLLGIVQRGAKRDRRSSRSRCASCRRRRRRSARRRATTYVPRSRRRSPPTWRTRDAPTLRAEDRAVGVGDALVETRAPPPRPRARARSALGDVERQHAPRPTGRDRARSRAISSRARQLVQLVGLGQLRQLDASRATKRSSAAGAKIRRVGDAPRAGP